MNELYILGTRDITINKSGKQETQIYESYAVSFNTNEVNQLIVNSDNPFEEWCTQIRKTNNYRVPTFIWELEENKDNPQILEREELYFKPDSIYTYDNPNPNDIVSYKESLAEEQIKEMIEFIQELTDADYDIKWIIK